MAKILVMPVPESKVEGSRLVHRVSRKDDGVFLGTIMLTGDEPLFTQAHVALTADELARISVEMLILGGAQ